GAAKAGIGFVLDLIASDLLAGATGLAGARRALRYRARPLDHRNGAVLRLLRDGDRDRHGVAVSIPGPLIGDARVDPRLRLARELEVLCGSRADAGGRNEQANQSTANSRHGTLP